METLRALIVDDSVTDAKLIAHALRHTARAIELERVDTAAAMHEALVRTAWDVVICDWSMPEFDARAALDTLASLHQDLPFIIVSGVIGDDVAVDAMRAGAHDYVLKGNLARLAPAVEREIREAKVREERRRSNEALLASEERYRRIVETTNQGIWMIDNDGLTTFMNARMVGMLGYGPEEVVGRPVLDFVAEDWHDLAIRDVQRSCESPQQVETKLRRKDGGDVWALLEVAPARDPLGRLEGSFAMVMDVTERRRSEEALRVSESRLRQLWESGLVLIVIWDTNGRIRDINEAGARMLGYTRAEILAAGFSWIALTPPEWRSVDDSVLAELRDKRMVSSFEKELFRKDGSRLSILAGAAFLDAEEGMAIAVDVTEKRSLQLARKLAEERKSAVVDTALDAVVGMDAEGNIAEFNPAAERTFGYTRAEVLGRPMVDVVIPAAFRARHLAGVARYLATGEAHVVGKRVEITAIRRDGVEFPVELSLSRVGSGAAPSFVAFIRDISERKRVERALVERIRVAALGSEVGMALTGGDTLPQMLEGCCESVVRQLGAAFACVWTSNAATNELELQASAGMAGRIAPGNLEAGAIAEPRLPLLLNDLQHGSRVSDRDWAQREGIHAFAREPLLVGGELMGVLGIFAREPLTEVAAAALASISDAIAVRIRGTRAEANTVALEEQLRQSQKMDAVGRLAGGIAHDFNNILSVILSYSDLILDDLEPGDPIREDIGEIHKAGARAADLTRQLLLFSRQQVVEPKVLDLNEVLSSMEKMLRRLVREDVELTSIAGASLGLVRVDPGSIEQVIMNLVVNARDAMRPGGKLTLETANVDLDAHYAATHIGANAGSYVRLSVTDTGAGIDPATLRRIFEPFFTTKEPGKGTGLGLATVFGIVQQSRGHIWVETKQGVGTTVHVYLQRVTAPARGARAIRSAPAKPKGLETILLVEDEQQVRDVVRGILRRQGYTVLEACNGGEALLLCERHPGPIQVLVSDVVMPGMSGPELASRLVQVRPDMKVLCMSGYTDDAAVREGVSTAMFAYLQKPITPETLARKVREVLDAPPPSSSARAEH